MSVSFEGQAITLIGDCGVEEAETLMALLQDHPGAPIDLGAAGAVHTALWQVLMVLSPRVIGEPGDPFTRRWIIPLLT